MGVPAEVPLGVHVAPTLEPQRQFALTRLNLNLCPQRLIFVASCNINDDLATRQPALARSVGVGVGDLSQPHISTDINMPSAVV